MGLFGKRLVTAVTGYWIQLGYRSYPEWIHSDREKVATSSNFFAKVEQDNCRADTLAAGGCRLVGKWVARKLPYVATFFQWI